MEGRHGGLRCWPRWPGRGTCPSPQAGFVNRRKIGGPGWRGSEARRSTRSWARARERARHPPWAALSSRVRDNHAPCSLGIARRGRPSVRGAPGAPSGSRLALEMIPQVGSRPRSGRTGTTAGPGVRGGRERAGPQLPGSAEPSPPGLPLLTWTGGDTRRRPAWVTAERPVPDQALCGGEGDSRAGVGSRPRVGGESALREGEWPCGGGQPALRGPHKPAAQGPRFREGRAPGPGRPRCQACVGVEPARTAAGSCVRPGKGSGGPGARVPPGAPGTCRPSTPRGEPGCSLGRRRRPSGAGSSRGAHRHFPEVSQTSVFRKCATGTDARPRRGYRSAEESAPQAVPLRRWARPRLSAPRRFP